MNAKEFDWWYSFNAMKEWRSVWLWDYTQVAQLWERDRAKLDTFSINFQRYSQNHEIAFLGYAMGASGAIQALSMKVLMQRIFVAEFYREHARFTRKTAS